MIELVAKMTKSLREELEMCKRFPVDTEMENGRQIFQFCHEHTGCSHFEQETRHSFRKNSSVQQS